MRGSQASKEWIVEALVYGLGLIDHLVESEVGMHVRMTALGHLLRFGRLVYLINSILESQATAD